jgi:hypothetical protein
LGLLTISARSDPAWISDTLQINAQEDVPALATVISPTIIPTDTPPPTATVPQPTPTIVTGSAEGELAIEDDIQMGVDDLLLGLFGVVAVAGAGYFGTSLQRQNLVLRFRCTFLPIITGLLGYNYMALGFPGSSLIFEWFGVFATLVGTMLTGIIGLVLARVWCRR